MFPFYYKTLISVVTFSKLSKAEWTALIGMEKCLPTAMEAGGWESVWGGEEDRAQLVTVTWRSAWGSRPARLPWYSSVR